MKVSNRIIRYAMLDNDPDFLEACQVLVVSHPRFIRVFGWALVGILVILRLVSTLYLLVQSLFFRLFYKKQVITLCFDVIPAPQEPGKVILVSAEKR